MIGPRPRSYACACVDPVLTSESYDISVSISTRRTDIVLLVVMLMSPVFSLSLLKHVLVLMLMH